MLEWIYGSFALIQIVFFVYLYFDLCNKKELNHTTDEKVNNIVNHETNKMKIQ
jgi:hypothetical protein